MPSLQDALGAAYIGGHSFGKNTSDLIRDTFFALAAKFIRPQPRSIETTRRSGALNRVTPGFSLLFKDFIKSERTLRKNSNHLFVITLLSNLVDRALANLISEPAKPLTVDFIDVHLRRNPGFNPDTLMAWHDGKIPTVMMITEWILIGIRRGLRCKHRNIVDFVHDQFHPDYVAIATNRGMIHALRDVRTKFRNPAIHLACTDLTAGDYQNILNLTFGTQSIDAWMGGSTSASGAAPVLHHHLLLKK